MVMVVISLDYWIWKVIVYFNRRIYIECATMILRVGDNLFRRLCINSLGYVKYLMEEYQV